MKNTEPDTMVEEELTLDDSEYEVGHVDDFKETDRLLVEVGGSEIAIFRKDSEYYAVANYCPHQAGPLCEGPMTGKIEVDDDMNWRHSDDDQLITCPWHYWKFDIESGKSVKDEKYQVPTYDVVIRNNKIIVQV